MDTNVLAAPASRRNRRHAPEFKARVIAACLQPGVSIAAAALANGLNVNFLRSWVKAHRDHRSAGAGRDHRWRTSRPRPACEGLDPEISRSSAAVSHREDQRTPWRADCSLNTGAVGGAARREPATLGRPAGRIALAGLGAARR